MVHEEEGARRPDAGAQTFARGLDVLAVVVGSERPLTITEVARESGLNRSIAYRLLRTLEDRGMVVQADGQGYRAGLGLLRLVPPERRILVEFARPALATLAARTGATAVLSVRDRHQEVVALCVPPPGDQPTIGLREGSASVLGRGVAATALLALDASGEEEQEPAVVRSTADLPPGTTALALAWRGEPDLAVSTVFFTGTVDEDAAATALVATARALAARA